MNGDSYIVRIYRRETDAGGQRACDRVRLVGRVDPVDSRPARAFHDLHELWAALSEADPDPIETGSGRRK